MILSIELFSLTSKDLKVLIWFLIPFSQYTHKKEVPHVTCISFKKILVHVILKKCKARKATHSEDEIFLKKSKIYTYLYYEL